MTTTAPSNIEQHGRPKRGLDASGRSHVEVNAACQHCGHEIAPGDFEVELDDEDCVQSVRVICRSCHRLHMLVEL
jgi:hypothetical protein